MMLCTAGGCCGESGKSQDSFYHLPRDQTLKSRWLQKLKRDNLQSESVMLFEDECFK